MIISFSKRLCSMEIVMINSFSKRLCSMELVSYDNQLLKKTLLHGDS